MVVAPSSAPEYAMPAAAWAAKAGDPVLWADKDSLPAATKAAITAHRRPRIYVLGPASAISDAVVKQLGDLGTTRRISGADPAANSVAFARFNDGKFGWNAVDPGHGLVFASKSRPADAAAAAGLSGAGTYGPLLVNTDVNILAKPLQDYLLDIQPGYDAGPGARRLQPRLDHGRREGDLGRRAVAHRRAARDPARAGFVVGSRAWPKPSSPSASPRTAPSASTTCAS